MASVTLRQVKTANPDGTYTLASSIIATAGGIPAEIFTFSTQTNLFSHISTIYDLITWGTTAGSTDPYYRVSSVTLNFSNPVEAEQTASDQITIINTLVKDYNLGAANFTGTVDTNITGV
jgi:hypothetical protein